MFCVLQPRRRKSSVVSVAAALWVLCIHTRSYPADASPDCSHVAVNHVRLRGMARPSIPASRGDSTERTLKEVNVPI